MKERILVSASEVQVWWGDMDAFVHVNSSRYFTCCEQARVTWFDRKAVTQPCPDAIRQLFKEAE